MSFIGLTQRYLDFFERKVKYLSQKVSISPTFYEQLFGTKVFRAAFLYLQLRFVDFWRKEISAKAAYKMLVKLTIGGISRARALDT